MELINLKFPRLLKALKAADDAVALREILKEVARVCEKEYRYPLKLVLMQLVTVFISIYHC